MVTDRVPTEEDARYQDEVEWEREMLEAGILAYRKHTEKAVSKKQVDRLAPVRTTILHYVPSVAKGIKLWLNSQAKRQDGARTNEWHHVEMEVLKALDMEEVAYITLRHMFAGALCELRPGIDIRRVGPGMPTTHIISLVDEIGASLVSQYHMTIMEDQLPGRLARAKREMKARGSSAKFRARRHLMMFRQAVREGALDDDLAGIGRGVKRALGVRMFDIAMFHSGAFQLDMHTVSTDNGTINNHKILTIKDALRDKMAEATDRDELMSPLRMPMIMPPRPWTNMRDGGYISEYIPRAAMVSIHTDADIRRSKIIDELDTVRMPDVYKAINAMQDTGWCINERVLDVVEAAWAADWAMAGLPMREEEPLPERPQGIPEDAKYDDLSDPDKKRFRKYLSARHAVHTRNHNRVWSANKFETTVGMARRMRDKPAFYYPHFMDFRGRMYPSVPYLQPQGDDMARGLLTFSEAERLGEAGVRWLALHLANVAGRDKLSVEERIQWVEENEALWRAIDEDPMHNRQWLDLDKKPWQTLAAIFEWCGYLRDGPDFMTSLPVTVDGTCNGIQHLAALTRDSEIGAAVNLIPADAPHDIYAEVAEEMTKRLTDVELHSEDQARAARASWWLEKAGPEFPRSLPKRQVMIMPYGGRMQAYFKYTREWLEEQDLTEDLRDRDEIAEKEAGRTVHLFCEQLWDVVKHRVERGVEVMDWLKNVAKVMSDRGLPLYWQTPSGYLVRHFYGKPYYRTLSIKLTGEELRLRSHERTPELHVKEQLTGIAPNFIHSLDAAALHLCVSMMASEGIKSITTVHDAYGTTANNAWLMHYMIRHSFVEVHKDNPMGTFLTSCVHSLRAKLAEERGVDLEDRFEELTEEAEALLPQPPQRGDLNIEDVLDSTYFFH